MNYVERRLIRKGDTATDTIRLEIPIPLVGVG
jgi:hypothetical protein